MEYLDYRKTYRWINRILDIQLRGIGRLGMFLARLAIPPRKGKLVVQTLHDFRLLIDPEHDNSIEHSIFLTGTYEKGTLRVLDYMLDAGDIFIDAGANIGVMSLYASGLVGTSGKVYAFEANESTKEILDFNISLNNLKNIISCHYALGSKREKGQLFANRSGNRGGASLLDLESSKMGQEVQIIRLDEFQGVEWKKVKMIKVDVEGFEMEVLKGCHALLMEPSAPGLIVECSNERNNFNYTTRELYQFIKGANDFRIFKLKNGKEKISPFIEIRNESELPEHDNIFCFLPHHLQKLPPHSLN